ncbi:sulfurtransferase TusA family protein [Lutispora thermophila]|uniref:TusA-related sulfurtransferase n=1 Tax=Lutispora thermophila DSM 19022 TaxID=1122184 RepID=A0A1M6FI27_9FIRM|nr:sulfurtransferase TusA family protein [Lutispora thermophila]SHI97262.1 TusA-related sulfurtransferase [Lutispora thermophila DSM 19022]
MKLNSIDARGRSCPEPALITKKALQGNPEALEVLVDNMTARENVTRFAKNSGYNVEVIQKGSDYILNLKK